MSEFANWHRAASEEILAAVNGADTLNKAQHYAELELDEALSRHSRRREVLARAILGCIEDLRKLDRG